MLLSAIAFFLILVIPPFFFSVCYEKRFEETVFPCSGAIILILFACGIIGILGAGVYIIFGIALSLLVLSICSLVRNREIGRKISVFFSPAFVLFFLIYLILLIAHYGRLLHEWDEFSHWGDVVKAMTYVDDFSTNPNAHSVFRSYVPGMALFQYLCQKTGMLFSGGAFADWRSYFSYHLLAFISLLPFVKDRKWKHFLPVSVMIICVSVIPSFLQRDYLFSLYIDAFVGLLAGVGFALLFTRERATIDKINVLIVCPLLVLAKDVGLLFAITIGFAFIFQEWRNCKKRRSRYIICALATVAVGLPKLLWEINIRIHHVTPHFRNPIDWNMLFQVFTFRDHSYLAQVRSAYFHKLFTVNVPLEGTGGISVTYPLLFILLLCTLFTHKRKYAELSPEYKSRWRITGFMLIFTVIVYLIGLPVMYMFRFDQYEAVRLASFDRYLSIVFDCLIVAAFLVFVVFIQRKQHLMTKGIGISLVVALALVNPNTIVDFVTRASVTVSENAHEKYATIINQMLTLADGKEKHVWIISQENVGDDYIAIRYGIRPCNDESSVGWSLAASTDSLYEGDIWTKQISVDDFKERLKEFDYVLIYAVDDSFVKDYASLFENPEEIGPGKIYTVNHETELLSLAEV